MASLDWMGPTSPIDATTAGATSLGGSITGSGQHIAPTRVVIETVEADSVSETAIISIGFNSPDYDDVIRAHAINPVEKTIEVVPLPPAKFIEAGAMHVRVIRAATATSLTFVPSFECVNYIFT